MGNGDKLPELRLYVGEQRRRRFRVAAIALLVGVLLGWFGKEPLTDAWRQIDEPRRIAHNDTNKVLPTDSQGTSALRPRFDEYGELVEATPSPEKSSPDTGTPGGAVQSIEQATAAQQTAESSDNNPSDNSMPSQSGATTATEMAPAAGGFDGALPSAIVDTDRLNMRAGPGTSFPVIETLIRGVTVTVLNDGAEGWVQIQSLSGATGYVARDYLNFDKRTLTLDDVYGGASTPTAPATCVDSVGVQNGTVLEQSSRGRHTLRIQNGTDDDGVVKLKTANGKSILAFYVEADQTAEVATVPDGVYRIVFATGRRWSRNCGRFLDDMQAMQFDRDEAFRTRVESNYEYYRILTYTLHRVADGNAPATHIPLEDF